jgi:hypothetical protein
MKRISAGAIGTGSWLLFVATATGCTAILGAAESEEEGPADASQVGEAEVAADIAETDADLKARNPELFEIAQKYFPSSDSTAPQERFYRLTRRQLDLTAQALLPGQVETSALVAMPPDPLIRNYELANDLGLNT